MGNRGRGVGSLCCELSSLAERRVASKLKRGKRSSQEEKRKKRTVKKQSEGRKNIREVIRMFLEGFSIVSMIILMIP